MAADELRSLNGDFMERQIGHLLRRAYIRARKNSAAALAEIGNISPVQASALAALLDGPLSQVDLGRRIEMEPANTYTLVARLMAGGLVVKEGDSSDRRLTLIRLSDDGARMAARLEATLMKSSRATLSRLSVKEQHRLVALLHKLDGP